MIPPITKEEADGIILEATARASNPGLSERLYAPTSATPVSAQRRAPARSDQL